jgi:Skp family chaperone for outer membrane proteins
MKLSTFAAVGIGSIAALGCASSALAQAKPPAAKPAAAAAPAAAPVAITATVPGVCVLSREGLIGSSTVGKYIQTRMGQLGTQVNAELSGEQTTLQADAKKLEATRATLQPAQLQTQGQALQQRAAALQEKAQQRDRELQATEQKAIARVLQEASPLVADVVKQRACGILLDSNSVLAGNPAMDVTPPVVQALNGKFTQFDFEREHLDAQAGAQQAR